MHKICSLESWGHWYFPIPGLFKTQSSWWQKICRVEVQWSSPHCIVRVFDMLDQLSSYQPWEAIHSGCWTGAQLYYPCSLSKIWQGLIKSVSNGWIRVSFQHGFDMADIAIRDAQTVCSYYEGSRNAPAWMRKVANSCLCSDPDRRCASRNLPALCNGSLEYVI